MNISEASAKSSDAMSSSSITFTSSASSIITVGVTLSKGSMKRSFDGDGDVAKPKLIAFASAVTASSSCTDSIARTKALRLSLSARRLSCHRNHANFASSCSRRKRVSSIFFSTFCCSKARCFSSRSSSHARSSAIFCARASRRCFSRSSNSSSCPLRSTRFDSSISSRRLSRAFSRASISARVLATNAALAESNSRARAARISCMLFVLSRASATTRDSSKRTRLSHCLASRSVCA